MAQILDGKKLSLKIQEDIKIEVKALTDKGLRAPGLAVILVGSSPASQIYVNNKRQSCDKSGFYSESYDLPETTSQETLLALIKTLNEDKKIDGILVQLPLPSYIDTNLILDSIKPDKDVDGFHPHNVGLLSQKRPVLRACTPYGVIKLLKHYEIDIKGKHAVIVGASNIVGRPMTLEFLLAGATTTTCHRFTRDLKHHVAQADIVVAAIGKPGIIQSEWLKPGCIVIDIGINRGADGKITGDIDFASAERKAAWITPVPGGVGPMTVTMLLVNTLFARKSLHDD